MKSQPRYIDLFRLAQQRRGVPRLFQKDREILPNGADVVEPGAPLVMRDALGNEVARIEADVFAEALDDAQDKPLPDIPTALFIGADSEFEEETNHSAFRLDHEDEFLVARPGDHPFFNLLNVDLFLSHASGYRDFSTYALVDVELVLQWRAILDYERFEDKCNALAPAIYERAGVRNDDTIIEKTPAF